MCARTQLLVAEAQLMASPPANPPPLMNLMDDELPTANGNNSSPAKQHLADPEEAALRAAFAALLADSGTQWQQANRTLRALHFERLKAGQAGQGPQQQPPRASGGPVVQVRSP